MGRGPEVVKMSGTHEPMWVAIRMCMEAMLGVSLYSYLYLKVAKTLGLSYYRMFSLQKIREQEGRTGSSQKQLVGRVRGMWPKQCTHM
jgi:hypothetical protein